MKTEIPQPTSKEKPTPDEIEAVGKNNQSVIQREMGVLRSKMIERFGLDSSVDSKDLETKNRITAIHANGALDDGITCEIDGHTIVTRKEEGGKYVFEVDGISMPKKDEAHAEEMFKKMQGFYMLPHTDKMSPGFEEKAQRIIDSSEELTAEQKEEDETVDKINHEREALVDSILG